MFSFAFTMHHHWIVELKFIYLNLTMLIKKCLFCIVLNHHMWCFKPFWSTLYQHFGNIRELINMRHRLPYVTKYVHKGWNILMSSGLRQPNNYKIITWWTRLLLSNIKHYNTMIRHYKVLKSWDYEWKTP